MYQSCQHFLAALLLFHHPAPPCNLKNLFHAIDVHARDDKYVSPKKVPAPAVCATLFLELNIFRFNPEFSLSLHGIAQHTNYLCLHPRICGI